MSDVSAGATVKDGEELEELRGIPDGNRRDAITFIQKRFAQKLPIWELKCGNTTLEWTGDQMVIFRAAKRYEERDDVTLWHVYENGFKYKIPFSTIIPGSTR